MAYEKQTWATGDVITESKLNHMEDGIANGGGGSFVVHENVETSELDKTWNEIFNAIKSNTLPIIYRATNNNVECEPISMAWTSGDARFSVSTFLDNLYIARSADGYPVHDNGE